VLVDLWAKEKFATISIREYIKDPESKKICPKKNGMGITMKMETWAKLKDNIEAIDRDFK
jgi:hypothetical protein